MRVECEVEEVDLVGNDGRPTDLGSSPDVPMLDVPVNDWRWMIANWPHPRWARWSHRVNEILAEADRRITPEDAAEVPRADAEEIRGAQHRAFREIVSKLGE